VVRPFSDRNSDSDRDRNSDTDSAICARQTFQSGRLSPGSIPGPRPEAQGTLSSRACAHGDHVIRILRALRLCQTQCTGRTRGTQEDSFAALAVAVTRATQACTQPVGFISLYKQLAVQEGTDALGASALFRHSVQLACGASGHDRPVHHAGLHRCHELQQEEARGQGPVLLQTRHKQAQEGQRGFL